MNLKTPKLLKLLPPFFFLAKKIAFCVALFLMIGNPIILFSQEYYDFNFIDDGLPTVYELERKAKSAFKCGDYHTAYHRFQEALEIDSTRLDNLYGIAESARHRRAFGEARIAYKELLQLDAINEFPFTKLRLAEMEINKGDTIAAEILLLELQQDSQVKRDSVLKRLLDEKLEFARSNPQSENPNQPVKLDTIINTCWAEISPIWKNGMLFYSSLAYPKEKDKVEPPRKFSKVLYTDLENPDTNVANLSKEWANINIPDTSVAHVTFTPDANRIYFTICEYPNCGKEAIKGKLDCQLYYRDRKVGTLDEWSLPIRLPDHINYSDFTSTHPAYGLDSLGAPVLYFVTNRTAQGTKEDMDIWYTKILPDNKFGKPINLEAVNTPYNEITPFYHSPSKTLFFSSEGYEGLGGYDIYSMDTIKQIENLKQPYNSSADDRYYSLTDKGDRSFFVTNRFSCYLGNIDVVGCDDIYQLEEPIIPPIPEPCSTTVEVYVNDKDTQKPITDKKVKLKLLGIDTLIQQDSNTFKMVDIVESRSSSSIWDDYFHNNIVIHAEAKGYVPNSLDEQLEKCELNTFKIPLCKPKIKVNLFSKKIGTDKNIGNNNKEPLYNSGIKKFKSKSEKPQEKETNSPSNIFVFNYEINESYEIIASHDRMDPKQVSFSSNECDTSLNIVLEPRNTDFDTIACYFAHDIPDKTNSKTIPSFDILHDEYTKESVRETYRDSCSADDNVDYFFETKVDRSFKVLQEFKGFLLEKLKDEATPKPFVITIEGYASNVGPDDYNERLAERRILSVENYLLREEGLKKYKMDNVLIINHDIKGEIKPKINENRSTKSIYHPDSAERRRVEIIRKL